MDEAELDAIRQVASRAGLTVSDWVRRALAEARRAEPSDTVEGKLRAIHDAASYSYPSGHIDTMLHEIEAGYLAAEPD